MAKMEQLLLYLPSDMKKRLKEEADRIGISMAYVVKQAIDDYLRKRNDT